ncbi:hypothetical protein C8K36_102458 [Rhodococcus sp. OK519]|uniref:hypothetical protein n=1 Tax=Rhodococcus sp. OK519 TaxID=2135729 RepID=UPI000D3F0EE8|nr:hypothetical protein C8K36_102458 [Rhodococcus sp. OK519]
MGTLAQLLAPASTPTGPQTTTIVGPHQPNTVEGILQACGLNPDTTTFLKPPAATRKIADDGTTVYTTYRYQPVDKPKPADLDKLTARTRPHKQQGGKGHWMVFQAGDQQIGKRSRDGSTEQIIERYYDSLQAAVDEHKHLKRHGIEGIQISMPGDCIEGVVSQGGKNAWLTQETITEQVRILRRLMLHTVDALAPLADKVYLDVVGGNHDEAQRQWNTYPGDNWATECALAVKDAMLLNPKAYSHVEVRTPDKWSGSLTVPVGDTTVTVVHGHQWSRGKGLDWLRGQDFGRQDARGTQILQHGHEHEWSLNTTRDVTRVCSPTYDCGSDWFRERAGGDGKRGGLVYLLKSGQVSRMSLV